MLDAGADGNNLLIGNSMTICDESSGDNSADTNVEELEPTIQSLELDQKFNDAESYLIESGEISSDGGGKFLPTHLSHTAKFPNENIDLL